MKKYTILFLALLIFINISISFAQECDLALKKPVKASRYWADGYPQYAVDDNHSTAWRTSESTGAWMYVDLGSVYTVNKAVVSWGWDSRFGISAVSKIQASIDTVSWADIATSIRTREVNSRDKETLSFTPTSARYVRFYASQWNGGWGDMEDFEVYALEGGVCQSQPGGGATNISFIAGDKCIVNLSSCSSNDKSTYWKDFDKLSGVIQFAYYLNKNGLVCYVSTASPWGQSWPVIKESSWWCGDVLKDTSSSRICSDSDNGKDYYVKGTANDGSGAKPDFCSGDYLYEFYCTSDNIATAETYRCANGCSDGSCNSAATTTTTIPTTTTVPIQTCTDSDGGKNYYTRGSACIGNNCQSDTCSDTKYLNEKYCFGSEVRNESFWCNYDCENGACFEPKFCLIGCWQERNQCVCPPPQKGLPDLTINDFYTIGDLKSGSTLQIIAKIRNQGNATAGSFGGQFTVDGNVLKCNDFTCDNIQPSMGYGRLDAGQEGQFIAKWVAATGAHSITFKVDSSNTVNESVETNNEKTLSVTITNQTRTCTDSDGGKNYYQYGSVQECISSSSINSGGGGCYPEKKDFCSGDSLYEYYCNSGNIATAETYRCANGCNNGACISNYDTKGWFDVAGCTNFTGWACDPDNYSSPLTIRFYQGNILVGQTIAQNWREDAVKRECGSISNYHGFSFLTPASLKDGVSYSITAKPVNSNNNEEGWIAGNPKIVYCPTNQTKICTDSDGGKNYYVKGIAIDAEQNATDLCSDNLLYEYSCNANNTITTETYRCPDGCSNGACINTTMCTDSDGGKNYYVKGTTVDKDGALQTDYCAPEGLYERFCYSNGYMGTEQVDCPNGCSDGACLKEKPPETKNQIPIFTDTTKIYLNDSLGKTGLKNILLSYDFPSLLKSGSITDSEGVHNYIPLINLIPASDVDYYLLQFEKPSSDSTKDPTYAIGDFPTTVTVDNKYGYRDEYAYKIMVFFDKEINITAGTNIVGEKLTLFGKDYYVMSDSTFTASSSTSNKLVLSDGAEARVFKAGETEKITLNGIIYDVTLVGTVSNNQVVVKVGTDQKAVNKQTMTSVGGLDVFVIDIQHLSNTDQTLNSAELLLGADRLILQHNNKVKKGNNEDTIQGTMVNLTIISGKLKGFTIYVGGKSSDDDNLALGGIYSDPVWKTFYLSFPSLSIGMTDESRDKIEIYSYGNNVIRLFFKDVNGETKAVDWASKASDTGQTLSLLINDTFTGFNKETIKFLNSSNAYPITRIMQPAVQIIEKNGNTITIPADTETSGAAYVAKAGAPVFSGAHGESSLGSDSNVAAYADIYGTYVRRYTSGQDTVTIYYPENKVSANIYLVDNSTTAASTQTCTDSDGGKDYYTRGAVSVCSSSSGTGGGSGTCVIAVDSCDGNRLIEKYCDGNKAATENYNCPNGCSDGKCFSINENLYVYITTNKYKYKINEDVEITATAYGNRNDGSDLENLVMTAVIKSPHGEYDKIKMNKHLIACPVSVQLGAGEEQITSESLSPNGCTATYAATFQGAEAAGFYGISGESAQSNVIISGTSFEVFDPVLLEKYLILENIDGYEYIDAQTAEGPEGSTAYAALYQKDNKDYAAYVIQFDSIEKQRKAMDYILAHNKIRNDIINGQAVYVFDYEPDQTTVVLWTHKNFIIATLMRNLNMPETSKASVVLTATKITANVQKTSKALIGIAATPSSGGGGIACLVIPEPVCLAGTVPKPMYDDNGCIISYTCTKLPLPLIKAYLDKYPSDLSAKGTQCESKKGYCISSDSDCRRGYAESSLSCNSNSEKCCVKEVSMGDIMEIVVKLDSLKNVFKQMQQESGAMADYYDSIGDSANAKKYHEVSDMFGTAADKTSAILQKIKDNLDNPDAIMDEVKKDIQSLKDYIKEIIKKIIGE